MPFQLLFLFWVVFKVSFASELRTYFIKIGEATKIKDVELSTSATSYADCAVSCWSRESCFLFSHNAATKECLLGSAKFQHPTFFNLTGNDDWVSGSFPGQVLLLSPNNHFFSDVKNECTGIGAREATMADLQKACHMGFSYNSMGFIDTSMNSAKAYKCDTNTGITETVTVQAPSWCVLTGSYVGNLGPNTVASAWVL